MNPLDRLAYDPRFSVWRIRNRFLRALAMWASVLICLPLYLAWRFVGGLVVGPILAVGLYTRSLPWRQIGRALVGREVRW